MVIKYNENKLSCVLHDFYCATGVNINLVDSNFSTITQVANAHNSYCIYVKKSAFGRCRCTDSDRALLEKCKQSHQVEMHICHAGLLDIAIPIIYHDTAIAYLIMGQMKVAPNYKDLEEDLSDIGLSTTELRRLYSSAPDFNEQKIQSVANLAVMLTRYILLENILTPSLSENIGAAEQFIKENLEKELTIQSIAKGTNLSKSVLYKDFHTCFNCTVKEYINTKRIEKAVDLLQNTELSIEDISQAVGFNSATYFSKIFKLQKGISPLKFRKHSSS